MDKKIKQIFTYLKELFPNPETELRYDTPFQFLVAVMLSAQATDIQVNKATESLFRKVKTPQDLISMKFENFERAISSINYYHTKAKHIYETASLLINNEKLIMKNEGKKKYKNWIPDSLEELVKFPGIGVKTAKVVAHVLYDKLFIAVDTHIHRVSNRLGLVSTKTPNQTSELLEKLVPDSYKHLAHHTLVLFGRYYCTAKKPKCEGCKLKKICLSYKNFNNSYR